ncbi:MAG TPA: hypothetical protein VMT69_00925, partial [Kineosporiaceae bacterium]|nr:hypothetical protein [Kineosporiaceae bacterium]
MNGGRDSTPDPAASGLQPGLGVDELTRRIQARQAQAVQDGQVLAGAPFVADALARVAGGVDDLQDVAWPALSADQVAATVRVLARLQARVDAAVLASIAAVDDRDDVVPGARAHTAGAGSASMPYTWTGGSPPGRPRPPGSCTPGGGIWPRSAPRTRPGRSPADT